MSAAWNNLARNLKSRYPDDWTDRLASYRDGSNGDLKLWRGIGGTVHVQAPPKPPKPPRTDGPNVLRNQRIIAADAAGVPAELIAERFGVSPSAISVILANAKAWARS